MRNFLKMILCLAMALLLCLGAYAEDAESALTQRLAELDAEIADTQAHLDDLNRQREETLIELKLTQGAILVQMDIAGYGTIILELDPEGKHISLGGDLDGCDPLVAGFEGIQGYPRLADRLQQRGLSDDMIMNIFWNNAMGVIG